MALVHWLLQVTDLQLHHCVLPQLLGASLSLTITQNFLLLLCKGSLSFECLFRFLIPWCGPIHMTSSKPITSQRPHLQTPLQPLLCLRPWRHLISHAVLRSIRDRDTRSLALCGPGWGPQLLIHLSGDGWVVRFKFLFQESHRTLGH